MENAIMQNLRYKESWRRCKCGSRIVFNAHLPGNVAKLCKKCQQIADMKQTKIHEFDNTQKTIEHFNGDE